jgi:nucleotide-binding universal stress UspA family protein
MILICYDGSDDAKAAIEQARALLDYQPAAVLTAKAILAEAEELGATAIVIGSRGLGGLRSELLGSASQAVIQHADRTVIVAPSPAKLRHRCSPLPKASPCEHGARL